MKTSLRIHVKNKIKVVTERIRHKVVFEIITVWSYRDKRKTCKSETGSFPGTSLEDILDEAVHDSLTLTLGCRLIVPDCRIARTPWLATLPAIMRNKDNNIIIIIA